MQPLFCAVFAILAALATSFNARADIYSVDRYFTQGTSSATLTGTVGIPEGNYTITDESASPFTSVNLTLTVNGTPYNLNLAFNYINTGTGQFLVDATSTTLTFNTADGNISNPADLVFSDNTNPATTDRYVIGYDAAPGFEAAYTVTASFAVSTTLPTVFGTAVPEPATLALAGLGSLSMLFLRRQKS